MSKINRYFNFNIFKLPALQKCKVDEVWSDFNPDDHHPFGQAPTWISFNPATNGQLACIVVLAVPKFAGDKFRVLEKIRFKSESLHQQVDQIKHFESKYNVKKIIVDIAGIGRAIYALLNLELSNILAIEYSLRGKELMLAKMIDIIICEKFEYLADEHDEIENSFMAINQKLDEEGISDIAWTIMQAIMQKTRA